MAKLDEKIGFIGGGNMAYAIGSGLAKRGIVKPTQILVCDPHIEKLERFREFGADITSDIIDVLDKSDIIFLCIKPVALEPCAHQLRAVYTHTGKDKIFVSVLAGVTLEKLMTVSFNNTIYLFLVYDIKIIFYSF